MCVCVIDVKWLPFPAPAGVHQRQERTDECVSTCEVSHECVLTAGAERAEEGERVTVVVSFSLTLRLIEHQTGLTELSADSEVLLHEENDSMIDDDKYESGLRRPL